ncbi:Pantoate--beta-alanine ligase (EC 6.3.2.1) [uncultured Gammaproteobacteria bacterium]|uniref:pantoate--beta-alanine ligase n=1 Tax=Bathymodiolus heckerae thiotrophic gill symbiont TaxID=1052212 RepID=UPI0010B81428|nr:pantoate--beta-alanine ligase [Bathymodiolus heckerae thiotrophic gill symbiont]CAC9537314.1 Pantoate--beta-alanine ligase (EC 6.3.2.1) [uncultured Gammaproteobacteria bacterium]CAC9584498.1 Pantoate--beta-alanine ligase (EC 6.3.2.1) [uncultured Gammaproteobacteria bacterium]CAC9586333.1 Pantoate--beta-alanine ligase (EC 6.3.2.1) [uncultured Gammaproteobacteria bacterium]CAC9591174.1 Pantoate--beta-alanine ligase (EC 6.3.2.1) [uncultured Gammaproteobacteria bacterium]SHN90608.1 Pantoate--be
MQVFNTITNLQSTLDDWRSKDQSIAFVPTMGGLHAGHLSLVTQASQAADKVVVSIFVNPAQFGEGEDFGDYPRTLEGDLSLLKELQVDCAFTPSIETIYPNGVHFGVEVGEIGQILCGKTRPHFFTGVVQVVGRLFDIIRPEVAVFGQKDYQQLHIIKRFSSGVKILSAPIVREKDGLAMSTRNQYLSANERKIAVQLRKTLLQLQKNELDLPAARKQLQQYFKLDYLVVLDANTLSKITNNTSKIAILCAVFLGSTRLIDNIIFNQG